MSDVFDTYEKDGEGNYLVPSPFGFVAKVAPAEIERARAHAREIDARTAIATMTRPPLDLGRPCAKCGHGPTTGGRPAKVRFTNVAEQFMRGECGRGEALLRTCRRCEYTWAERCVDAAEGPHA